MKFSIIAIALFAAVLGQAAPVPDDEPVAAPAGSVYTASVTETKDILTNKDAAADSAAAAKLTESPALADHSTPAGSPCAAGLKVNGFARLADYTVYGHDFDGATLAKRYADGYFDNFGGPIIARALARSDALPGRSDVFVQAQTANYFWHKSGSVADVIGGLSPNRDYATYVAGDCSQFQGDVLAKCCY